METEPREDVKKEVGDHNLVIRYYDTSDNRKVFKIDTIVKCSEALLKAIKNGPLIECAFKNNGSYTYSVYLARVCNEVDVIRGVAERIIKYYHKHEFSAKGKFIFSNGREMEFFTDPGDENCTMMTTLRPSGESFAEMSSSDIPRQFRDAKLAVMHEKCERTAVICRGNEIPESHKRFFDVSVVTKAPKVENCKVLPAPEEGEIKSISVSEEALEHAETCSKAIHGTSGNIEEFFKSKNFPRGEAFKLMGVGNDHEYAGYGGMAKMMEDYAKYANEKDTAIRRLLVGQLQRSNDEVADELERVVAEVMDGAMFIQDSPAFKKFSMCINRLRTMITG